ncbi:mannosyltransferase putative-domain-containing protein, partial [Obelidium mucronatum]
LPIEVHYAGELDLPLDMVTALNTLPNVKCVNLLSHFPNELDNFATWSLKPFSLLAASFRNVIFIDADVLFFKNPATAILKDSKIFKKYRQLFFHDRTIDRRWGAYSRWFRKAQPVLTPYAESLRFLNGLSRHELESGVVALDKGDPGILHSLIYACKMNSAQVRNETYSHVHGDKETFWMAMEMARVPFRFTPGYSGAVGYLDSEVEGLVCGNMFHSDEELEPFWWNGGILMMKHVRNDWFMRFEHVVNDLEKTKDKWVWETDTKPNCIRPVDPQREVSELKGRERQIGQLYIEMYKDLTKL